MSLSGRISQNGEANPEETFRKFLGESNFNNKVLLSLKQTEYIDSSGIGWILSTDKKIRAAGGKLVLHSLPLDVQHVFGLMKLQLVLNIAKDRAQAESLAQQENQQAS